MIDLEELDRDDLLEQAYTLRLEVEQLRERNQMLAEELGRVKYERDEDQSELERHPQRFMQIQGLAPDAKNIIRECRNP